MRVMCITNAYNTNPELPMLEIGSSYNEIDQKERDGQRYYCLEEFDNGEFTYWYNQKGFAALPESTATEMYEVEIEGILF